MIVDRHSLREIPKDWAAAAVEFSRLERTATVRPAELSRILDWLRRTPFDEHSYIAGEAAALVIQKFANSKLKQQIWAISEAADDWLLHFCVIILANDESQRVRPLLDRASKCSLDVVRRHAIAMLREKSLQRTRIGKSRNQWKPRENSRKSQPAKAHTKPPTPQTTKSRKSPKPA